MKSTGYEIQHFPIDRLFLNDQNPRRIKSKEFTNLVKSLSECPNLFEARPLICSDRTGELIILGGNMRYRAALELKYKECPAIVISGLTEEQEREIIIKDNGAWGEWDMDMLASWDDLPLSEWGVNIALSEWSPKPTDINPEKQKDAIIIKIDIPEAVWIQHQNDIRVYLGSISSIDSKITVNL